MLHDSSVLMAFSSIPTLADQAQMLLAGGIFSFVTALTIYVESRISWERSHHDLLLSQREKVEKVRRHRRTR